MGKNVRKLIKKYKKIYEIYFIASNKKSMLMNLIEKCLNSAKKMFINEKQNNELQIEINFMITVLLSLKQPRKKPF